MSETDYIEYYDLEKYLFDKISARYRQNKTISAEEFFCIVIWKANRAKSKIAKRLLKSGPHGPYDNLDSAVHALMQDISNAPDSENRLAVLIKDWGFLLPMASAILTVLFPDEFTIYDVWVCTILKKDGDFEDPGNKTNFDMLWKCYLKYVERVKNKVPQKTSLRDKDRYLVGQSFKERLGNDVKNLFGHTSDDSELEV